MAPTDTVTPTITSSQVLDDLDDYFQVEFEYDNYLCQETWEYDEYECVRYDGYAIPSFYSPDLYCSGPDISYLDCSGYDPSDYFEVSAGTGTYLCQETWGWNQYDCVSYSDGSAPSFYSPDRYCSGSKDRPDCSKYWYPNELDDYDLWVIGGSDYLCQRASSGEWDDYDCSQYTGGDPDRVSFFWPDLKCTDSYGSLECGTDSYPSEAEDDPEDDEWNQWDDEWDECWEDDGFDEYWDDEWEDECW